MDRCALFVDAGYALADGALAVHGTRHRDSVTWDYAGLLKLLAGLSRDRTGLPVLRCYWYEATVDSRRTPEHDTLADIPGLKLRVGKVRPGRREGVETEIRRDLTALARNKAVTDVIIVSAEEDLAQVISDVQDQGLRVALVHIAAGDADWTVSRALRQECDDVIEISAGHLRPYVDLIPGAEPAIRDHEPMTSGYRSRDGQAGQGAGTPAARPAAAAQSPAAQPAASSASMSSASMSSGSMSSASMSPASMSATAASPGSPAGSAPAASGSPSTVPQPAAPRAAGPAPEMPASPLTAQPLSAASMPNPSLPVPAQPSAPSGGQPPVASPPNPALPPPALYSAPVSGEYPRLDPPAGGSTSPRLPAVARGGSGVEDSGSGHIPPVSSGPGRGDLSRLDSGVGPSRPDEQPGPAARPPAPYQSPEPSRGPMPQNGGLSANGLPPSGISPGGPNGLGHNSLPHNGLS
ncbi:MAG TPA: NYN domain-containing protein, partial [Streptosporangiaceae bacterium]